MLTGPADLLYAIGWGPDPIKSYSDSSSRICQNSGHEGVTMGRNLAEESPHELPALSVDRRLR